MKRRMILSSLTLFILGSWTLAAGPTKKTLPKEALQVFNDLIGSWRGTGEPNGTGEQKQRLFWQEKIAWQWRFSKDDVYLQAAFDRSEHFSEAVLRYLPGSDRYQLTATTPARRTLVFEGTRDKKRLTLDHVDGKKNETQRLTLSLLHPNRYLYHYDVKPADRASFTRIFSVGATKQGVEFASGDDARECVVSGGLGTKPVVYKGRTYYVCCTGCRDAFKDEPEKYIKEFEARKKTGKKAEDR